MVFAARGDAGDALEALGVEGDGAGGEEGGEFGGEFVGGECEFGEGEGGAAGYEAGRVADLVEEYAHC